MNARSRSFVFAILLAAVASVIGIALLILPENGLPLVNRGTDIQSHIAALNFSSALLVPNPAYDTEPNPHIGIITVDDASLKSSLGPWPFKRSVYGTLLDKLRAAGAKAVVFDIDFLEPSADPTQDAAFARAMRSLPTVLAYTINTTSSGQLGEDLPAPDLASAAAGTGFSTVDAPGGYLIGQPLEIRTDASGVGANQRLVSLPAAAYEAFTKSRVDNAHIPKLNGAMVLLPPQLQERQDPATGLSYFEAPAFAGASTLSFKDAYADSASDLRPFANGNLVYIGATAQGLFDYSTTARGRLPGLFINARLADQLLRHFYVNVAPLWLNIVCIIAFPLLIAMWFSMFRTTVAIAASLVATLVYAYVNEFMFVARLYWLDLVHVVLAMVLATLFVALYRILHEGAQRRMVTNLFGMHVSPAIVSDILSSEDPAGALALRGKKVKATIFYSDIRGFTAMSETMTPEEIYAQLNEYFEEMCAIIFRYGGYVDKFIGDCVMAVFSAPYQTPDDAANAVRAAVEQQKKIVELAEKWKAQGKREFTVGMGINTGDVVMGNLGASSRMNYTVIGDNVNLAARLYNVAKAGEIIISDYTYQEVKGFVVAEERDAVTVKGKKDPISIFNILDVK